MNTSPGIDRFGQTRERYHPAASVAQRPPATDWNSRSLVSLPSTVFFPGSDAPMMVSAAGTRDCCALGSDQGVPYAHRPTGQGHGEGCMAGLTYHPDQEMYEHDLRPEQYQHHQHEFLPCTTNGFEGPQGQPLTQQFEQPRTVGMETDVMHYPEEQEEADFGGAADDQLVEDAFM